MATPHQYGTPYGRSHVVALWRYAKNETKIENRESKIALKMQVRPQSSILDLCFSIRLLINRVGQAAYRHATDLRCPDKLAVGIVQHIRHTDVDAEAGYGLFKVIPRAEV